MVHLRGVFEQSEWPEGAPTDREQPEGRAIGLLDGGAVVLQVVDMIGVRLFVCTAVAGVGRMFRIPGDEIPRCGVDTLGITAGEVVNGRIFGLFLAPEVVLRDERPRADGVHVVIGAALTGAEKKNIRSLYDD